MHKSSVLGVVEQVYLQHPNEQPFSSDHRYSVKVESSEQAYGPRRMRVGAEWATLDAGWLTGPCVIVIRNQEGRFFTVIPTPEERILVAARVVEVTGGWIVRPGESMRARAADVSAVRLRCSSEEARIDVTVFPA